jgi:hypothetical protein
MQPARCPKTSAGWYNSVIASDFLVQNLETRIHMFLGGSPLFQIQSTQRSEIVRPTVISQNGTSGAGNNFRFAVIRPECLIVTGLVDKR